jgi:hypothetical protein
MMARKLLVGVLVAAVIAVAFNYVGGFSWRQSLTLAVAVYLFVLLWAGEQQKSRFEPFNVWVKPKWHQLLSDYGLLNSQNTGGWARLCEESNAVPASEYNVLRSGIHLTFLQPELVYWNGWKIFTTAAKFYFAIQEIKVEGDLGPGWAGSPSVYVRPSSDGYELGIEVDTDWWEQIRANDQYRSVAVTPGERDYECGTTSLAVATIPYDEFHFYWTTDAYDPRRFGSLKKKSDIARNKWGWKNAEMPDVLHGQVTRVEHKYFTVEHRAV